jgi:hypothetical protein
MQTKEGGRDGGKNRLHDLPETAKEAKPSKIGDSP